MLFALILAGAGWGIATRLRPASAPAKSSVPAHSDAGYVDSAACSGCHRAIWDRFQTSGMGRSMRAAGDPVMPPGFAEGRTFYHKASDRHYRLIKRDGKFLQRRHQIGPDGKEMNVLERQIDFVVGSGNHAKTFLHRGTDGRLYELPLAWYAERGGTWAMNPGYDRADHPDFRRQIQQECIFCHTAYPPLAPGGDRFGSEPLFPGRIPNGIDCQRCHGPGRDHIEAAGRGEKSRLSSTIVNPARLDAARQLDVCMQCHLETTSARLPHAIVRWERGVFSFRPGEPLGAYAIHFDHPPGSGHDDKFEIASHAYRLRKSACFVKSAGKMTCTTCHDPHGPAERARAIAGCRGCHAAALAVKPAHPKAPDCVACHMAERRTDDVVHVTMTDHWIQRRARNRIEDIPERPDTNESAYSGPVALYYPDDPGPDGELYLAVAQVKQFSNLKQGVPLLAELLRRKQPASAPPYLELAQAYAEKGMASEAAGQFELALRYDPDLKPARVGLSRVLAKSGQTERALALLMETLKAHPQDGVAWNELGLVHARQGRTADAIAAFRKAAEHQTEESEGHANLGAALAEVGDREAAIAELREAIRIQPDSASAHHNLAKLLTNRDESDYHYRQAIHHQPKSAAARHDYGLSLAAQERFGEAAVQFRAAIAADPSLAEAYSGLADMMVLLRRPAEAIPLYKKALSLRPSLEAARSGLQMLTGQR